MFRENVEPQVNAHISEEQERAIVDRTIDMLGDSAFIEDLIAEQTRREQARVDQVQVMLAGRRCEPHTFPENRAAVELQLRDANHTLWRLQSLVVDGAVQLAAEIRDGAEYGFGDIETEDETNLIGPAREVIYEEAARWVRSPNQYGNIGPDGLGYNAGLIHTIGYWASGSKTGRFAKDPFLGSSMPSVDYFRTASQEVGFILDDARERAGGRVVILTDKVGNRKFYTERNMSNGKQLLVIGFQLAEWEKPRISTFFTDPNQGYVDRCVEDALQGNDRGLLFRLETEAVVEAEVSHSGAEPWTYNSSASDELGDELTDFVHLPVNEEFRLQEHDRVWAWPILEGHYTAETELLSDDFDSYGSDD